MTFDVEANARQLLKELHEKGYQDAQVSMSASCSADVFRWSVGVSGRSLAFSNIALKYFAADCPLEAYEAAEKAIAALPDKDAEARDKLTEEAKELAKRMEEFGMTWEDVK